MKQLTISRALKFTIQGAVFSLLDGNEDLAIMIWEDETGGKRALQLHVEALLGKTVNPETLSRSVRRYKQTRRVIIE